MRIIKKDIGDALKSLTPSASFVIRDGVLEWVDEVVTQPTEAEINAEILRLQTEYDAQTYARNRQPLYPEIGDQLDSLYHAGVFPADMAAKIKKVKDDNPKG